MKAVEALLQNPELNVNALGPNNVSALLGSAANGDIETMTKLLGRNDINVNITNVDGDTPLHAVILRSVIKEKELIQATLNICT